MAIRRLSTPCVKLASFRIFSPASGETRVRAQAVENAFFNSLLGEANTLAKPKAKRAKESATCAQRPKGATNDRRGCRFFQSLSLTWERAQRAHEQRECRVRARPGLSC